MQARLSVRGSADRIDRDTLLNSNNPKLMHVFSLLSKRRKLIIDLKYDLAIYIYIYI